MKLCPLFESIGYSSVPYDASGIWFTVGVHAANNALPRDAIELAIDEMQYSADATFSVARQKYLMAAIEQLESLLPKGPL